MECLLQYLDELDDAVYAALLAGERVRRLARNALVLTVSLLLQGVGILLALSSPPLALAVLALLAVAFLYRGTVTLNPAQAPTPDYS